MKRRGLRSIAASRSTSGTPATWLRSPRAAYSGTQLKPLRPSRSERETSEATLLRHDTMPIPVTTTRRISEALGGTEQADAQALGFVDRAIVDQRAAVGDHHRQAP